MELGWKFSFGYAKLDIQVEISSWQLDEAGVPEKGSAGDSSFTGVKESHPY